MQKAFKETAAIIIMAGELIKNSTPDVILKKLNFICSDKLVNEVYDQYTVSFSEDQFQNKEIKFFAAYKYITDLVMSNGEVLSNAQDLLQDYRVERAFYYIVSSIIKRFQGTNDIVIMSIADPFIDSIEKLPKFYKDIADTIINQSEIDQIKSLDKILTAVKVEQKEVLKECALRAIEASNGMIFSSQANKDQSIKKDLQNSFLTFIDRLKMQSIDFKYR